MASVSLSWRRSVGATARLKPNSRRADSDAIPEAVATDCRTTPLVFRRAGKVTARAKLPAPIQLTLSSPALGARAARAAAPVAIGIGMSTRPGYSSSTVYARALQFLISDTTLLHWTTALQKRRNIDRPRSHEIQKG